MKKNNENGIFAFEDFMKHGVFYAIANSGKIIAAITLTVAALTVFTNITFTDLSGETFTITLIVMLLSSYVIYFSLEDTGEKEGELTAEYIEAKGNFLEVKKKIHPESIEALREFCFNYSENELLYRKKSYLCENGLTLSDLESYKNGVDFQRRSRRVLRRASLMKSVKLTVARLLSISHGTPKSELSPPEKSKVISTMISLVPSTLCTLFTVSVILTTKNELTVSTVIDGLLKLSALPVIGFKGFLDGYRYAKEAKSSWFETKTRVLEAFLLQAEQEN